VTERQQILAMAGLIYAVECVRWVRRGGVVFEAAPTPKSRRVWRRSPLMQNDRGDAFIGWPLPPLGEFLVVRGCPFSCDESGVVTGTAASLNTAGRPAQAVRFHPWETLRDVRADGEQIRLGGTLFWLADTAVEAAEWASWLRATARLEPGQRGEAIAERMRAVWDANEATARVADWNEQMGILRKMGSALWGWLFLVIPAAVWQWGWFPTLAWVVPPVFLATAWTARSAVRIHRKWFPDLAAERFRLGMMLAMSPLTAIRAADLVGRSRWESFHPAVVGVLMLPREQAEVLAAALWRDVRTPRLPLPSVDGDAARVVEKARARTEAGFAEWARKQGWDPAAWDRAPKRTDPGHARYCPRCQAQFMGQAENCGDCGGVRLLTL